MVKRLAILFCSVLMVICIACCVIYRKKADDELTSGGPYSHTYNCKGLIVDISDDTKVITVKLNRMDVENFSFISDNMYLDYSRANHLDDISIGDPIKFSFFLWNVENTTIQVQDIYIII